MDRCIRFLYIEGNIRLALNLPVTHIAVIWSVNFTDTLCLDHWSLEGPSHQVAERFVGVPYIRWFQNFRMSNGLFKFFRCQVAAVSFCKCKTIIFYIVAYSAFDLLNIMAAACYGSDQMYPEDIFHTCSNDGTAVFFCKNV